MATKIRFTESVQQYLKNIGGVKLVRSRLFRMNSKTDQMAHQNLINRFKKWIFYTKPWTINNVSVIEVFFDLDLMITEYSMHYGIKSGEEMITNGELKNRSSAIIKSLESVIDESLKDLERNIENTTDPMYESFIREVQTEWSKSFIINCVPNIANGNYVNIPIDMVVETHINDPVDFADDESYFFDFLNRIPLKINRIIIGGKEYFNIVNATIVPLFISLEKDYVLVKE